MYLIELRQDLASLYWIQSLLQATLGTKEMLKMAWK